MSDAGVPSSSGKKAHYFNDRNTSGSDYNYDAAGNLVKDLNRDINYIGYNVLGLSEEIRFTNNAKIFYLYTASGAKLQKQGAYLPGATPRSTLQKKIDYLAAGVFADNALTFIPTAEGRALPPNTALGGTAFRYEYQPTDHLDNLRTACRCGEKLDSLGNVVALLPSDNLRNLVQENAYDPWGLNLPDLERGAVLPDWWQFSTKELDYRAYDEFEFRHYDAAIGRFTSIDPLTQLSSGQTPFSYAGNNPSSFIDLYGLWPSDPARVTVGMGAASNKVSGSGGFLKGLGTLGQFLPSPLGFAVGIGIQATIAQNQPMSAADYNLSYLAGPGTPGPGSNSGCCPENQGPGDSYSDLKNDPLLGVKAFSGLFELLGYGQMYMLGRGLYSGMVKPLLVNGLRWILLKKATYKAAQNFKLTSLEVRLWYNNELKALNTSVAFTEENALLLSSQRNAVKTQARTMMADHQAAALLERTDPIRPFEYYVKKYSNEGFKNEELWQRIIQGTSTPNASMNLKF